MELTAENVHTVFMDCLFNDDEPTENHIIGEGIMMKCGFNPERLHNHEADIVSMLDELPQEFKEKGGGGWSFMNACVTKTGVQWGQHRNVDQLVTLGLAIKKVKFQLPREMWSILPGGMPYFSVTT